MGILKETKEKVTHFIEPEYVAQKLQRIPNQLNELGYDNWGMNRKWVRGSLSFSKWLYEYYFRVETYGIEKIPPGRILLVPNHSGQLPLDGLLIFYAMFMYADPPRVVRAMVERFMARLPFFSTLMTRCGHVVGDPLNCRRLLENDEAVLVFPEGVRGSGKLYWKRYQLQKFGNGFMRLALETNTPIVPIAIVGAEETYPAVYNFKTMAKLIKAPYFPITPFFPLLGPLGALPLPCKIRIHFGEPLTFSGDFDGPEEEIRKKVEVVINVIQSMLKKGLEERGKKYF